jgi:cytochrome c peroxidase
MHNGSLKTLADVVDFHDGRGKLGLSAEEKSDLVEFLRSLTGDEIEVGPVDLPEYQLRKLGD